MVYYYQQGGDIKFMDYNTGIESPHIVMENKEKGKYYYVVKPEKALAPYRLIFLFSKSHQQF